MNNTFSGAADLLRHLHEHGVDVRRDGDELVLRGTVGDEEIAAARSLKPDLLALLATTCGSCGTAGADGDRDPAGEPWCAPCRDAEHAGHSEVRDRHAQGARDYAAGSYGVQSAATPAEEHITEGIAEPSPLVEYAAKQCGARLRFTVQETADVVGDIAFLRRIRAVLEEWPGDNIVQMRIVTFDGRRPVVSWRAYACRELRFAIARLLAQRGHRP